MARQTAAFGRTIEDKIADNDDDWVKARNTATHWAHEQMDDGAEDIHEARENSVLEAEKNDEANYL